MNRNQFLVLSVLLFFTAGGNCFGQLVLNEVQSSNFSCFQDENGDYEDWIEIYNSGNNAIDLSGYGLSDNENEPFKFTFPSCMLQPQDHILVVASGENQTLIGAHWESAVKADDIWRYRVNSTNPPDTNWRNLSFNDNSWSTGQGGIGYGDSDDVTIIANCTSLYMRRTFTISDTTKIIDGVFNMDYDDGFVAYLNGAEIARSNVGVPGDRPLWNSFSQEGYEAQMYQGMPCDSFHISYDLLRSLMRIGTNVLAVEVHNQSAASNDLSSIPFLSFKIKDATVMFNPVPNWFPSTLHPKEYFHAAFKLSKTGETVYLTNPAGTQIDQVEIPLLEFNHSYGRTTDGAVTWSYFENATPDTTNNISNPVNGYATIPMFSLQGGFYSGTQTLALTTTFPNGVIHYTTNGNLPTINSPVYSAPITIAATQTIRARVFSASSLPSSCITNTYFINLNCKLPVYSLAVDSADLWDYNTGIFVKGPNASPNAPYFGANYWQDWQKLMSVEFFDKQKNRPFRFMAGLSITGGWSRRFDQKCLEVKLGDKFGQAKIQYEMIPDKKWMDHWDDFLLHTTGNDRGYAHMRDPVMERLMKGTFSDYTAYEPCLLFINGVEWGVYYTKENDDQNFVKANYGFGKNEIDLLKESYLYPDMEIKCGDDSAFRRMYNFGMNGSPSTAAFYNNMDSMIDLKNHVDYFAAECYYPNDDWMGGSNNNLKMWRPRQTSGRFRYILYDLDFGFGLYGSVSDDILAIALNPSPHNFNSDIFQRLLLNPRYKNYFINRYADLINTKWQPSNVASIVNNFKDSMRYDMHFQFDKWGNGDTTTWKANIDNVLNFSSARPAYARNQIQNDLGMAGQVSLTLQASPVGAGRIQISTITPQTLPWTGVYFNGNPVTVTAIPNPGFTFDHWRSNVAIITNDTNRSIARNYTANDVITAYFTGVSITPQLTFSEINYNSDSANDAGDWVELHNLSPIRLDLSGWKIKDNDDHHEFSFPVSTVIEANGYLVIASDLQKFSAQHPSVTNVIGQAGFSFGNTGDQVRLFKYDDSLFISVEYSNLDPWPVLADGEGYTLELTSASGDLNDPYNWFAGCIGGSPGRAYSAPIALVAVSGQTNICSDDTVLLYTSMAGGNQYQWQRNHVSIDHATDTLFRPVESGTYTLSVTNNGCTTISDSVVINIHQRSLNPVTSSVTRCGAGSVTLNASSTDSVTWYDDQFNLVGSGHSFTTPSISQTAIYYAKANSFCPSEMVPDTVTINTMPSDPVVTNQQVCGHGTMTLTATSGATVRWYDAPNGNYIFQGDTFATPDLQQTNTYYAQAGDVCFSGFIPAVATVIAVPANPVASSVSRCDAGPLTLYASATDSIRWYDAPDGNILATGSVFLTPTLTSTTTYYLNAGSVCQSGYTSVDAIISAVTPDPVISDQSHCGPGSITLTAIATDTVRWYDAPNGNLLFTGNSFVTPVLNENATYYLRAGMACASNTIAVTAFINPISSDPVTVNATRCGPGTLDLTASATDTVRWYDAPAGNVIGTGQVFNTPVLNQSTTYYARADGVCPGNYIPVNAQVLPIPADPITNDQARCGPGPVALTAYGADTIRWYDAPNGNLLAEGNSFITPDLYHTTSYAVRSEVNCVSAFVPVNAIITAVPVDPSVTSGSSCGFGTVVLTASSPDTVYWYDLPHGSRLGTGLMYQTPAITSTTTYFAEAVNGCEGNYVPVSAYVYAVPQVSLGNDTIIESGSTVVLDAGAGFVSYLWNTGETSETTIANSTGNYWVTVTDVNGCSITDTLQVLVTVDVQPYVLSEGVLIYPNPTHSSLSISFVNENNEDIFMRLIDDNGKLVWSDFSINEKRVMRNVDLNQYSRGLYVFQIANSKTKREFKIVLK